MLHQNLLTTKWTITISSPVSISTNITIYMTHIISIFFVELVIGDFGEPGAPEHETFFEVQADAFEEEGVLKTPVVFQVGIASEGAMQVLHT